MASDLVQILADFNTQLLNGVAISDTTATLVSGVDDDSVNLPNGKYGFTIDGDNSAKEYFQCTLTDQVDVTAIQSVTRQGVVTSGFARAHRRGASITITDWISLGKHQDLLDGTTDFDADVPLGYDDDPTLTLSTEFATKGYVDAIAIAGAPAGSPTTPGIYMEATQKQDDDGTAASTYLGNPYDLVLNPATPAKAKISKIRGETINGATTPQAVLLLNDLLQGAAIAASSVFGDAAATQQRGSKIKPQQSVSSTTVKVYLQKVASPVDNLTIEIQSDSAGVPSGTAITNGTSNAVSGAGLTTSPVLTTFTFGSAFTLAANTTYWVVIKRSGANDAVNYYKIDTAAATAYANFDGAVNNSGTWSAAAVIPYFEMVPTSNDSFSVWLSDANATVLVMRKFTGFVKDNGAAGVNASVTLAGRVPGFSNLIEGRRYFVTDTAGSISTTPGTSILAVGRALTTAELFIELLATQSSGNPTNGITTKNTADASVVQNIPHGLGLVPSKIKLSFISVGGATSPGGMAFLAYNGVSKSVIGLHFTNGALREMAATDIKLYGPTGGNETEFQTGVVTFDETNIIITWTKTNSPTGVWNILWEAN